MSRYSPVIDVRLMPMGFGRDGNVHLVVPGRPDGRAHDCGRTVRASASPPAGTRHRPSRTVGAVPLHWQVVRPDLWTLWGRGPGSMKITQPAVRTDGGGALFDQIVLGRAGTDLPRLPDQEP
ncbi:hypothetical protein AB0G54_10590 [Streptomyces yokosukanensis]|uniref:hypothetical protein n=1 Tax=Streptomyces yokosukanensis TaxID=67386 RepID=UPI0034381224